MITAQVYIPDAMGTSSHQHQASPTSLSPSWQQPDHPTAHDRFRQIFRNHWDRWCDQRLEAEVTDPGHYRVLVFDSLDNRFLSFGQYGLDESSFALPMGIAIAGDGLIYVTDARAGRVLVFDPLKS